MAKDTEMPSDTTMMFDNLSLNDVQKGIDATLQQINRTAEDDRWSDSHKQETIEAHTQKGLETLETNYQEAHTRLNERIEQLKAAGGVGFVSPPVEEAQALVYTSTLIITRFNLNVGDPLNNLNPIPVMAAWQAAVDSGDRITARAFVDMAVPKIETLPRTNKEQLAQLVEATTDLYLTDAQKKAREKLAEYEANLKQLETNYRKTKHQFQTTRWQPGQGLFDGTKPRLNNTNY